MSGDPPFVTVLMPVYNGEAYLREAIKSVLEQIYTNFEFLIIDDGSTDNSSSIVDSFADIRIRLVHNTNNLGLIATLNHGIDLAKGDYIARMDCDDICMPMRLARQVEFMEAHTEVGVCGSWAKLIDEAGNHLGVRKSPVGVTLAHEYWRPSPLIHPSCMIRTSLLKVNRYSSEFVDAEDYELWLRLSRVSQLHNMSEVLICYRVHRTSVTASRREQQLRSSYRAFQQLLGGDTISYEMFLALILVKAEVNPFARAYNNRRVCLKHGGRWRLYLSDNLRYAMFWLRSMMRRLQVINR